MKEHDLNEIAAILQESDEYQIIKRYQKPKYYNSGNDGFKHIGVFLDVETTGLSYTEDKIIELGMVKFEYTDNGLIFGLLDEFNKYQDPHKPISSYITKLTGITDDMVQNQQIDETDVANYLQNVDLIIAHNSEFDRPFFDKTFPSVPLKTWACSMTDINWKEEGISSNKLEYIAYKYNFFYEGHRAIIDCLAGIHVLAQELHSSKHLALKQLLVQSGQLMFKIWAVNAPYDYKDLLRGRGYKWNSHQTANYKAWSIELTEDKIEEEINYLRLNIYKGSINIPIEVVDGHTRFSSNSKQLHNPEKYQDKMEWVKALCAR